MARDALDPGEGGTYPWFPRDRFGHPLWSESAASDGKTIDGLAPMPRGLRRQNGVLMDVTPTNADGTLVDPPVLGG